jgi:TonB family protein
MRLRFWLLALLMLPAAPAFAAVGDAACTMPNQPLMPVMSTHTQPPYPQMSVMTKEQGTTILQVVIGSDGVPTDVTVNTSSGSIRLDQAAIDHVKANWRWNPPLANCKPIAVKTLISIHWNLQNAASPLAQQNAPPTIVMDAQDWPPDALSRHEQGTVVLTLYILANGQVAVARVIQTSGFPDLDAKSLEVVKARHWAPASLDGKPVNTALIMLSVWKLPDAPAPAKP